MRGTTKRSTLLLASLTLVVGAAAAGCGGDDANSVVAKKGGKYHVVFTAGSALVTDWDVFIAEKKGFYDDHNLDVESVTTETANDANQLIATGEAQIARGLPPMIQAIAKSNGGVKLIDVGDTLVRPPFTINSDPSVKTVADLKGKKVGTSSPTDSTTVVTQDVLSKLGLKSSDYQVVTAGGTSARLAGLESHALNASLMLPPINATAEKEGFHSIGYVPDLVGGDYKFGFSGVIVNPDWAKKNKKVVEAYLAARNDALKFLADPSNKDEAISILAEETKSTPQVAGQIYDMLKIGTPQSAFAPSIGIDKDAVKGTLSALQALGQAPSSMTADDLVDTSYASDAQGQ